RGTQETETSNSQVPHCPRVTRACPRGGLQLGLRRAATLLPTLPPDKKLSKIEILRLAICYISYLNHVLDV
ncbi:unnamed protein product, partial [Lampetra fluviatilis]